MMELDVEGRTNALEYRYALESFALMRRVCRIADYSSAAVNCLLELYRDSFGVNPDERFFERHREKFSQLREKYGTDEMESIFLSCLVVAFLHVCPYSETISAGDTLTHLNVPTTFLDEHRSAVGKLVGMGYLEEGSGGVWRYSMPPNAVFAIARGIRPEDCVMSPADAGNFRRFVEHLNCSDQL